MASQMAAVQQQLLQNPEMMRQMMKSPLIQNMLSNPEALRNMFTSNQQMQEPMEVCIDYHFVCLLGQIQLQQHPKLNHVLNNPDLMKQVNLLSINIPPCVKWINNNRLLRWLVIQQHSRKCCDPRTGSLAILRLASSQQQA